MRLFSSWYKYIIIAVIVVIVAASGIYAWQIKSSQEILSPGDSAAVTPTPTMELTTWTDEAGFSFQYPKTLSTNKHEEDNENYAHVELTAKDHPGSVIVWVKDPPKKWPPSGGTIIDSTLGGEPAKKIVSDSTLSIGCLCEDLLFLIEATITDKEYWTKVFDTVSGSFAFISEESPGSSQGVPAGADVDEEEIVE